MSEQIRVVIGDDHPVFREGVAAVLNGEPDLRVVGREANAADTIRVCRDMQPDIVVLDIDMPGDGLTAIRAIRSASCSVLTCSRNRSTSSGKANGVGCCRCR